MGAFMANLQGVVATSGRRRLIGPQRLSAPLALLRAQVQTRATALGANGMAWLESGADAPRFHGAAGRLLVEGQRTNLIRNPRGEGVAPGTRAPGAQTDPATNWRLVNRGSGLSLDVSAISADGMTGLRLRYHGTTGASPATETLEFDTRNGIAAPAGTVLTGSFLWRLAAGTLPQGGFQMGPRIVTLNASAAFVDLAYSPAAHPDATLRRSAHTMTAGAGVVNAVVGMHLQTFPASTALDFTIDVFWPQLEAAPFASTPILPPAGTPGASTRGADTVTAPFGHAVPVRRGHGPGVLHGAAGGSVPAWTRRSCISTTGRSTTVSGCTCRTAARPSSAPAASRERRWWGRRRARRCPARPSRSASPSTARAA
jgi:hypothetical protein